MLNLKSNVYRSEWLELVFADRNKLYGAYELRQNYSVRLFKAMLLAVSFFVCLVIGPFLYGKFARADMPGASLPMLDDETQLTVYVAPKAQPKKTTAPAAAPAPAIKQTTVRYTVPVVVPAEQITIEMPAQTQIANAVIGPEDIKGDVVGVGTNAISNAGGGDDQGVGSKGGTESNDPFISVQQMPEFPGGQEAFGKYLSKNLRYPSQAQENNIQGRVTVSFIVETDGSLSNIHVLRGIGAGCDEEAVRVIKKAPAWRPGKQNGKAVRVMYNVPIVFNLGE